MDFDAEMGRALFDEIRKRYDGLALNRLIYGCDDPHSVSFTTADAPESDTLTLEMLGSVISRFSHLREPLVGVTVQPCYVRMIEDAQSLREKPSASAMFPAQPRSLPFYGVPIYPVEGQIERWRTWSDRDALMAYLKEREEV